MRTTEEITIALNDALKFDAPNVRLMIDGSYSFLASDECKVNIPSNLTVELLNVNFILGRLEALCRISENELSKIGQ